MSALSRGGLFASFEDDREEVAAAEVVESADNAEADLGAAQDELNEAEEATRVVEQASDDADTLEEVADTLESREESGGATPEEIEMAEVTVESICNRLGIKKPVSLAAESFSSRSDRKRQTQLAVEGIREIGDTIWQTILKIYRKIREWIMKAWDYFFDARTKLLRRAKALEAKVDKVEGTPKESVIQGSFIEGLAHKGGFPSFNELPKAVEQAEEGSSKFVLENTNSLKEQEEAFKKVVEAANKASESNPAGGVLVNNEFIPASMALVSVSLGTLARILEDCDETTLSNGKKAYITKEFTLGNKLPGITGITSDDKALISKYKNGIAGFKGQIGKTDEATNILEVIKKVKVQYVETTKRINKDFKAKVLTESEMSSIVSKCVNALEDFKDAEKNIKKFTDSMKIIESIAQSAGGSVTKKLDSDAKKAFSSAAKVNTKITQVLSTAMSYFKKTTLELIRYQLDYVQKSLAQYKQDEDDED